MNWLIVLITLAAAFITVSQLSFVIGKEWRSARRIVTDPGTDSSVIAEHGCIPAQFAGSQHRPIRLLLAVWRFFWAKPTTPKQCFLARRVVGVRDGSEIPYGHVSPGDGVRVELESCEQPDMLVKSLRRSSAGGFSTIALRDMEDPGEQQTAHCVTVRARGRYAPSVPDGTEPLWLQFDIVSAAPRSTCLNGPTRLVDIPDDAVELLLAPSFSYQRAAGLAEPGPGRIKRHLLRHNANPWAALAHLTVRRVTAGAVVLGGPALVLGWAATWWLFATVGVAMLALLVPMLFALAAFRDLTRSPTPSDPLDWLQYRHYVRSTEAEWFPTTRVNTTPPTMWLGSTSHGLSIGRKLGHTDAASSIRHQWHRIAPWFRQPRWLYRQAKKHIKERRGRKEVATQASPTDGDA